MRAIKTWVVVADAARARIFLNSGPGKGLVSVEGEGLENEITRTNEAGTDRPGRVHDRFGPGRHAMAPRVDWHEQQKESFAHDLASLLSEAGVRGDYDRLVLVAPPKTLGSLRQGLGKAASDRVTGELANDLTHLSERDLPKHLDSLLVL